jgi:hypothetical protein
MTEQSNKRLEDLLEGVEGWLPLEDARYLCELAREAPADIVEIGCYRGRSTIALSLGASQSAHDDRLCVERQPVAADIRTGQCDPGAECSDLSTFSHAERATLVFFGRQATTWSIDGAGDA